MAKDFLQENCKKNVTSAKLCIHTGKQIACFLSKTNFSQKRKKKRKKKKLIQNKRKPIDPLAMAKK